MVGVVLLATRTWYLCDSKAPPLDAWLLGSVALIGPVASESSDWHWISEIAEMVNFLKQLPCCSVARNRILCIAEPLGANELDIRRDQKFCQSYWILQVHTDLAISGYPDIPNSHLTYL